MPIYEFYCPDCHRVFSFLSRRIETEKRPVCPRCARAGLERRVSAFAISKGRAEPTSAPESMPDLPPGMDEERMARAMESLAGEAEGLDESDPRQAAQLMRKMFSATGLPMGGEVEEAIRRMESGEDPEKVEAEMGDVLETAMAGAMGESGSERNAPAARRLRRALPPAVDPTLYEM